MSVREEFSCSTDERLENLFLDSRDRPSDYPELFTTFIIEIEPLITLVKTIREKDQFKSRFYIRTLPNLGKEKDTGLSNYQFLMNNLFHMTLLGTIPTYFSYFPFNGRQFIDLRGTTTLSPPKEQQKESPKVLHQENIRIRCILLLNIVIYKRVIVFYKYE